MKYEINKLYTLILENTVLIYKVGIHMQKELFKKPQNAIYDIAR